jgi:gluconokinase
VKPLLVVMGVSGAGKSVVGAEIADSLGLDFIDSDSLHPEANVAKMAAGIPLADEDRWPWLALVGEELAASQAEGLVVACSALKRSYRDAIRAAAPGAVFVLLAVPRSTLTERVSERPGHFMPASLLDSQLDALEPLEQDEAGVTVASEGGIEATAKRAIDALEL